MAQHLFQPGHIDPADPLDHRVLARPLQCGEQRHAATALDRIEVAFDAPLHQLAQAFLDRAGAVEDLRLCLAMSISDPLYWLGYHTNFWLSSHEIDAVLYLS